MGEAAFPRLKSQLRDSLGSVSRLPEPRAHLENGDRNEIYLLQLLRERERLTRESPHYSK